MLHTLVTSALSLMAAGLLPFELDTQPHNRVLDSLRVIYHNSTPEYSAYSYSTTYIDRSESLIYQDEELGLTVSCAGVDRTHILEDYYMQATALGNSYSMGVRDVKYKNRWVSELTLGGTSCWLLDSNYAQMWLLGDAVGSVPLWYGSRRESNDFIVTTDMIIAYNAGFSLMTPVAPGQALCLEGIFGSNLVGGIGVRSVVSTRSVIRSIYTIPSIEPAPPPSIVEYSRRLYSASLVALMRVGVLPSGVLGQAMSNDTGRTSYLIERDEVDSATRLLLCALDSMGVEYRVFEVSPLADSREEYSVFGHGLRDRGDSAWSHCDSDRDCGHEKNREREWLIEATLNVTVRRGRAPADGSVLYNQEHRYDKPGDSDNGGAAGVIKETYRNEFHSCSMHTPPARAAARRLRVCEERETLEREGLAGEKEAGNHGRGHRAVLLSALTGANSAAIGISHHLAAAPAASYTNVAWTNSYCNARALGSEATSSDDTGDSDGGGKMNRRQNRVIYPYHFPAFQDALHSARNLAPMLNLAVETLVGDGVCPSLAGRAAAEEREYFRHNGGQDEGKDRGRVDEAALFKRAVLAAAPHASDDGYLVVVVVTRDYVHMFRNWANSARAALSLSAVSAGTAGSSAGTAGSLRSGLPLGQLLPALVITPDSDVVAVAERYGAAPLLVAGGDTRLNTPSERPFGTTEYQQLMLLRTRVVLTLLHSHMSPIVADIDTVWQQDPLEVVRRHSHINTNTPSDGPSQRVTTDVMIVDDNGEWCGCFVVLHAGPRTLAFWREVHKQHASLLHSAEAATIHEKDSDGVGSRAMPDLLESEQKIITRLLKPMQLLQLADGSRVGLGLHKLLTDELYDGLVVQVLPSTAFPSGYHYFNEFNTKYLDAAAIKGDDRDGAGVVLIHNNHIIGKQAKVSRFKRHGLWCPQEDEAESCSGATRLCHPGLFASGRSSGRVGSDPPAEYSPLVCTRPMSELVISSPKHNQAFADSSSASMVHVVGLEDPSGAYTASLVDRDGNPRKASQRRRATADQLEVYVHGSDQMASFRAGRFALMEQMLPATPTWPFLGGNTVFLAGTNIMAGVDIMASRGDSDGSSESDRGSYPYPPLCFGADRGLSAEACRRSDEYVWSTRRELALNSLNEHGQEQGQEQEQEQEQGQEQGSSSTIPSRTEDTSVHVVVVVLAYNRPESLRRLLLSLIEADYSEENRNGGRREREVSLRINIDGPRPERGEEDIALVQATRAVAEAFTWPHGEKQVLVRPVNIGLAKQWLLSWDPAVSKDGGVPRVEEGEVAVVLEDDTEVSPLFYSWLTTAVDLYYSRDTSQRELQQALFQAATQGYREVMDFALLHAGRPLMFGLCLQQQHLAPLSYPRRHRSAGSVHNRQKQSPYLYSLIGTWGPLLFPAPWQAFRLWLLGHLEGEVYGDKFNPGRGGDWAPFIPASITNSFYRDSAAKQTRRSESLLREEGNSSSTSVHRRLIAHTLPTGVWSPYHVHFAFHTGAKCLYSGDFGDKGDALVSNHREAGENYGGGDSGRTSAILLQRDANSPVFFAPLPTLSQLTLWQYDLSNRRTGSLGADGTIPYRGEMELPPRDDVYPENGYNKGIERSLVIRQRQAVAAEAALFPALGATTANSMLPIYMESLLESQVPQGATIVTPNSQSASAYATLLPQYRVLPIPHSKGGGQDFVAIPAAAVLVAVEIVDARALEAVVQPLLLQTEGVSYIILLVRSHSQRVPSDLILNMCTEKQADSRRERAVESSMVQETFRLATVLSDETKDDVDCGTALYVRVPSQETDRMKDEEGVEEEEVEEQWATVRRLEGGLVERTVLSRHEQKRFE